jgi:hypothetical protein
LDNVAAHFVPQQPASLPHQPIWVVAQPKQKSLDDQNDKTITTTTVSLTTPDNFDSQSFSYPNSDQYNPVFHAIHGTLQNATESNESNH